MFSLYYALGPIEVEDYIRRQFNRIEKKNNS